jgi:uncharacterized protein YndB with AHSA1/START domain
MRRRDVNVTAVTPAPVATVFGLLADGSTWPTWSPIESFELEQAGVPPPEGVSAIRRFRLGRTTGHDQILELVPNRGLKYSSRSNLPVRDYVGEVVLGDVPEGGTTIHWHSSFLPKTPGIGWIVERGIRRFLEKCTRGLAEYATSIAASRGLSEP